MTPDGYTFIKLKFDKNGMQQHYIQFTPESLKEINDLIHQTYIKFDKYEQEMNQLLSS